MAQDRIDPNAIQWTGPAAEQRSTERRKDVAGAASSEISAAKGAAELPYVKPSAEAELTKTQQTVKLAGQKAVDDLRAQFEGNKDYQNYAATIPALSAALSTSNDPMGDVALTYYAAKLFDPGSAVREGEQATISNAQAALQRWQAKIMKEFGLPDGGTFSTESRERLRRELIRRSTTLNKAYNRARTQYRTLSEKRGYDPADVIGEHLGAPYRPEFQAYSDREKAAREPKPEAGQGTAGLLGGVPAGAEITGEPIQGYRFTPEQEQDIVSFANSPQFTPEGYRDRVVAAATQQGVKVDDQYAAAALAEGQRLAGELSKTPRPTIGGFSYRNIDKAATEQAPLGQQLMQAGANIPESGAQFIQGMAAPFTDITKSIESMQPEGLYATIPALVSGALSKMGVVDADEGTVNAVTQMLSDRYGGVDNLQRTFVQDPIGVAGDLSLVLTGGGTALSKVPGITGRVGADVAKVGRYLDPLSAGVTALTKGAPALANVVPEGLPSAIGRGASEVAAFPSGAGGTSLREAAAAGRSRGLAGAPTPQSEAFTGAMRDNAGQSERLVDTAKEAIGNLRIQASQAYQTAMQQFGLNPAPLDINVVRQRMAAIKPRNYDAMYDAPRRPTEHVAWEQMNDTVEHYAQQAAQNPGLLMPLEMDQFKQDLYDIGSKVGGVYDRDAARVARTAYNGVKDELIRHDPIYADTMKDYEKAAGEMQQLETSFGLREGRGKPVNIDAATRRLQSIMRNNAYTNYGQRASQAERLAELDPTGTLFPMLGGQTLSSGMPRGLRASVGLAGTSAGAALGVPMSGLGLAALPLTSPRVTGELAYGAGRLAGTGERIGRGVMEAAAPPAQWLVGMQRKYPEVFLGAQRVGAGERELERRERERMAQEYGINLPEAPEEF